MDAIETTNLQEKKLSHLTDLAEEITALQYRLEEAIQAIEDLTDRTKQERDEIIAGIRSHFALQIENLTQRLYKELHSIGDEILSSYENRDFIDHIQNKMSVLSKLSVF